MSAESGLLESVHIATPCPVRWESMSGDDRVRFCGRCELNVFNLAGMDRAEAEDLLVRTEGRLCIRVFRRSDGTVLTRDCPGLWTKPVLAMWRVASAAVGACVALFVAAAAFVRDPDHQAVRRFRGAVDPVLALSELLDPSCYKKTAGVYCPPPKFIIPLPPPPPQTAEE